MEPDFLGKPSASQVHDGIEVLAWHGIRYARTPARFAPPLADRGRLQAPQLVDVPIFPQLPSRLSAAMGTGTCGHPAQSEDAFFLNVWAPANAQGLPMVFFIHGGAWMTGGASMPWYDGARLAALGLVVVSANYRLGALGHLGQADAHSLPIPAADLLQALHWSFEHASAVGANPDRISLMGQSAGGWYAHLLSVLPQTRGLVHRVALLSMGTRAPWSVQQQADTTSRAQALAGGDLQGASTQDLLRAGMQALQRQAPQPGHAPSAFLPVASSGLPPGLLDPAWAAQACHAEAVLLRCTADESATFFFQAPEQLSATQEQVTEALSRWAFADLPPRLLNRGMFDPIASGLSPYRQLVAASSWRQFQRFPAEYAAALRRRGRNTVLTQFHEPSALPHLHCGHCLDLPFQFGNLQAWQDAPMLAGISEAQFHALSRPLMQEMADFVQG